MLSDNIIFWIIFLLIAYLLFKPKSEKFNNQKKFNTKYLSFDIVKNIVNYLLL